MSEPVVVNTGPLVALSCCGAIGLITGLHARVVLPVEVRDEANALSSKPGFEALATLPPEFEIRSTSQPPTSILTA